MSSDAPYSIVDEPWPYPRSSFLAASGSYDVPVPMAELPGLLADALHGSERLVATRIDDDSAEVRRRTTVAFAPT